MRHLAEYLALRFIVAVFRRLPYRASLALAWCLAWMAHHVFRYRTRVARERISRVFGDSMDKAAVRRTAWLSWRNFVFGLVDLARVADLNRSWFARNIENMAPFERTLMKLRSKGKGALLASPHMGAWDLAGVAMQQLGAPIFFTAARQKNPFVDHFLGELRGSTGVAVIRRGSNLMRTAIEKLRSGEWMAIMPDIRAPSEGVQVRFLGGVANVHRGMAVFARRADVPIIVGIAIRRGWVGHVFHLARLVTPDLSKPLDEDVKRMTQEVFDEIDKAVRRMPEQWFWYNKRWVLDPLEAPDQGAHAQS